VPLQTDRVPHPASAGEWRPKVAATRIVKSNRGAWTCPPRIAGTKATMALRAFSWRWTSFLRPLPAFFLDTDMTPATSTLACKSRPRLEQFYLFLFGLNYPGTNSYPQPTRRRRNPSARTEPLNDTLNGVHPEKGRERLVVGPPTRCSLNE